MLLCDNYAPIIDHAVKFSKELLSTKWSFQYNYYSIYSFELGPSPKLGQNDRWITSKMFLWNRLFYCFKIWYFRLEALAMLSIIWLLSKRCPFHVGLIFVLMTLLKSLYMWFSTLGVILEGICSSISGDTNLRIKFRFRLSPWPEFNFGSFINNEWSKYFRIRIWTCKWKN